MKIAKLMTQAPENIRTDGPLLAQDPAEIRKSRERVEEDGFKLIRPEQAYINFSKASKHINTLDVEVLQSLGLLPSVFLHEIPDVASPSDWELWIAEGYNNLVYMSVHSGQYDQSSFATIKEEKPKEDGEENENEDEEQEQEEEKEEELETSEVWGPYPVAKSREKILILKTVMSPLTVFPCRYLFETYFPKVLSMRFGMPESNTDYSHWVRNNMDTSYLRMILQDAYDEFDKNGPEAALEVANQRLMLSSSVVRNVTATKSSVFSEEVGTFSPMKELLALPLRSGDRVFMSLALGGGKSTELHVAQCESVLNSMSVVCKHLTLEKLEEFIHLYWESEPKTIEKLEYMFGYVDEILDSDNEDLVKAVVKSANPKCDYSEWSDKDRSIYQNMLKHKPESKESRRVLRIYWWRKKIQKFVDRVNKARKKAAWTGTLMEMTLSKKSSRLTDSKVPYVTFLDIVDFIEFWRDHDPMIEHGEAHQDVMDPRIYDILPDPFKRGLYHDLRVIHVSNNEELDAFVKTYTLFDLDSTTVQALNANNVSGLSKDESILMKIPCPVVTAQRRNWNSTEFFGARMQVRSCIFDERTSSEPISLNWEEWAYCWDIANTLFGSKFFRRAMNKEIKIDILEFRTTIFNYMYSEMKDNLREMLKHGIKTPTMSRVAPIVRLACASSNYPREEYAQLLERHFKIAEKAGSDELELIPNDHPGIRKLCLSSSKIAVEFIFEIINRNEEMYKKALKEAEEAAEDEAEIDS